ncbi:MAG TPA: cytochrome d ubiquinol oxidase subunit II [Candidatus Limnocylindrales bacterium]
MDLATIWFLLIGVLLVGYAVLDGFDLGAGILHLFVARDDRERRTVMAAIGPVWDGNEVWLLTGGGALFAAFPAVYATVFSGFYLALMLLLVALILRAVSLEFRSHVEWPAWRLAWDVAFAVGSFLPALLFGVALGNVLEGLPLTDGEYRGGLIGLLNPFALLVGLLAVAMVVQHGGAWLALKTEGQVEERARRAAAFGWLAFGLLWLVATAAAPSAAPHLADSLGRPLAWLAAAAFVLAMAAVRWALARRRDVLAFAASGGSIAAVWAIVGAALYPNLVPASGDGQALTVAGASSSQLSLTVMLVVALVGMPLVIAYTAFIYSRFRGKVRLEDGAY